MRILLIFAKYEGVESFVFGKKLKPHHFSLKRKIPKKNQQKNSIAIRNGPAIICSIFPLLCNASNRNA